jgi:hypothetical protein
VTLPDVEWRRRLEFAAQQYAEAKRAVVCAANDSSRPGACSEIEKTKAAESEALREYTRVLSIFARLVLDREPPPAEAELSYTAIPHTLDERPTQRR